MKPNCLKCEHFFVTWEATHPRGCNKFGFKGKELPSDMVYKSSGYHCPFFTPKGNKADTNNNTTKGREVDELR